jgi:hypothetical protein
MALSEVSSTPSAASTNAMLESSAAPHKDCPGDKCNDGALLRRPLMTTLPTPSLIAPTSASDVVTHFSAALIATSQV